MESKVYIVAVQFGTIYTDGLELTDSFLFEEYPTSENIIKTLNKTAFIKITKYNVLSITSLTKEQYNNLYKNG
jgi:hypothetical protein